MKKLLRLVLPALTLLATTLLYAFGLWAVLGWLVAAHGTWSLPGFKACAGIALGVHLLLGRPQAGGDGYWQELRLALLQAAVRAATAVAVAWVVYML